MIANYHTHTYRCGHAEGTEREYAECALKAGFETLGFSDHTPYDFFDSEPRNRPMRMKPEELPEYADSIRALAAEYDGKLEIIAGVEAEYYPKYFPRLLELLRENGIRYMILGQHCLGNEIDDLYCGFPTEREADLERYVSQTSEALSTRLFSYFAHPDLINYVGSDAVYERHMRRLCRAAKDSGTPLEINLLGMNTGRNYPDARFWKLAAEEGNDVVFGIDAHRPEALLDAEIEQPARQLADSLGLTILPTVPLRTV